MRNTNTFDRRHRHRLPTQVLMLLVLVGLLSQTHKAYSDNSTSFKQAPAFNLPEINTQQKISLDDYQGKVVLIDFWASWCGPCRKSLPEYNDLRNRLQASQIGDKFEILAINVDMSNEEALAFLTKHPVDFPVLEERTGKSQQAYDLLTMPTSFLVDQQGKIRIAHQGFNPGYIEYLEKEIGQLFALSKSE